MWRPCILLSLICLLCVALQGSASAANSPWLSSLSPTVTPHKSPLNTSDIPSPANSRCVKNISFITRPANYLQLQLEQATTACAVQTAYGLQSGNRVTLTNTSVSGVITLPFTPNPLLQPIPYSKHLINLETSAPVGTYVSILRGAADNFDTIKLTDNTLQFKLRSTVIPSPVTNQLNEKLDFKDVRFSDNGKWLVGDVPYVGMTRVNIETGKALIFGPALNYNNGLSPRFVTAISGDGRYATFADFNYEMFRVYDLSTCTANPDLRKPETCQWKDLLPVTRSRIANFGGVTSIDFSTNHTLKFTALQGTAQGLFTITAAGESESLVDYLATGDSFASGEGAYNYKPYTDVRDPLNTCHSSLRAYSFLVAAKKDFNHVESIACSGARMKDLYPPDPATYSGQAQGKSDPSFDDEIYRNYLAGYRAQNMFIKNTKPRIVITSIGGNDIGFAKIIAACASFGTCYDTPQDRLNLGATIEGKYGDLSLLYGQIKHDAATNANVYVIGYPELVDPTGNCAVNVRLEKQELLLANQIVHTLNNVIQRAATSAGVTYVDVTEALKGHRLCETKSSDVAVNGLTAGDDKTFTIPLYKTGYQADVYLLARESYHPNQLGHKLLADVIAGYITAPTPGAPPRTDVLPSTSTSMQPIRITDDQTPSQPFWIKGKPATIDSAGFGQNAAITLTLAGSTQVIGAAVANQNGQISTTIQTSQSLPTGLYTLQITGKNRTDETIRVEKLVYVAASDHDIDGDTLPNALEKCLFTNAANLDTDEDNIDDACDGYINQPPIKVTPVVIEPISIKTAAMQQATHIVVADKQNNAAAVVDDLAVETPYGAQVLNRSVIAKPATELTRSTLSIDKPYKKRTWYFSVMIFVLTLLLALVLLLWRKRE